MKQMRNARVVRFTDVSPERIAGIVERIEGSDGPPEGIDSVGMELFYDADQQTAVFVGYFEDAEKMAAADAVLESMDAGDTPGTRASVDRTEIKVQQHSG